TWTGGTMGGAGVTVIESSATFSVDGSDPQNHLDNPTLDGRTLELRGSGIWSGTALQSRGWIFANGGTFTIESGVNFDIQGDDPLTQGAGAMGTWNIAGTLTKSAGAGASEIGRVNFNNSG